MHETQKNKVYLLGKSAPNIARIVVHRNHTWRIIRNSYIHIRTSPFFQVRIIPKVVTKIGLKEQNGIFNGFEHEQNNTFHSKKSFCNFVVERKRNKMYNYHSNWLRPELNANSTSTYRKKNFMISITIRDNDTWSGPRCGFTENM